jgi:dienelactone hydrolase
LTCGRVRRKSTDETDRSVESREERLNMGNRALVPALVALLALASCGSAESSTTYPKTDASVDDAGGSDRSAPPHGEASTDGGIAVEASPAPDVHATGDGGSSGYGPYGSAGPASVSTVTAMVSPPMSTAFSVTVYLPGTKLAHPVVILNSGFFQSALGYAPYGQRLASWGVVAILRDDPGLGETTVDIGSDDAYIVTTWLAAQNAESAGPFEGLLDATNVGLAGHSRGGQAMLLAAENGAKGKIKGVFGLDPVDGSMDGSPDAVTNIATIDVPLTFIGETTDSTGASACAPAADNYQVLYAAAAAPAVSITAIDASHPMFEDPSHCTLCSLCTAGTANAATVLAYSERYLTAFFARELLGDGSVGPTLEGAGSALDASAGLITLVSK